MDPWRMKDVSGKYVQVISKMIYDEPIVMGMVSLLQGMCLRHGIFVRWGFTPATPSFQACVLCPFPISMPRA